MSTLETIVSLNTQPATVELQIPRPDMPKFIKNTTVPIGIVTGMALPSGVVITNPLHFTSPPISEVADSDVTETITLPEDKASRLAALFGALYPGHRSTCHDVVTTVADWDPRKLAFSVEPRLADGTQVTPGAAYGVLSPTFDIADGQITRRWGMNHSCLGTDDDRLLGVMGESLMLATISREAVVACYGQSVESYLAEIALPGTD